MSQIIAYILIVTDVGREYEVLEELSKIEGVSIASVVYGEFDVVCIIRGDRIKTINKAVMRIRKIQTIIRTVTLISH